MKKLILLLILLLLISESLNSQPLFSLNEYFQQNEQIKLHILWETENEVFISFDNWTEEMKSDLDSVLQKIIHQQDLIIQDPIKMFNEPEPERVAIPSLFPEAAWKIYLAHIAQNIIVDHFNYVRWDLNSATEEKLDHLFSGSSFYKYVDDHYEVKYEHGNATLGNPIYVFNFLRKNNLIGINERNTIERILEWGRDNLQHYSRKPGETLDESILRSFNGFQGWYPPVKTIIDGVSDGEKTVHFIRGCHGTTGFLKALCRVINIEVQDNFYYGYMYTGHSQTVFPSINSFLCHADDVFSTLSKTSPRLPISKLLYDFDSYNDLFNDELKDKNVRKSVELMCDYLPFEFPNLYCQNGLDYILEGYNINNFFGQKSDSVSQKLQLKMDSIINNYGGCLLPGHWEFFNKYGIPPFHNLKSEAELLSVSLNTPLQTNIVDLQSQTIRITLDESLIPDSLIAALICSDCASIRQLYGNKISINNPNIFEVISEDLLKGKIWKLIINDADDCQVQTENTVEICEGESYKGWDITGIYKDTLIAVNGCDSINTTNLTIHELPNPDFTFDADMLTSMETHFSYQWYDQNGIIEGATSEKYVIEKSGTYYLEATNENGCTAMSEGKYLVKTGVNENEISELNLVVIPNPNDGKFWLRFENAKQGVYQVQIINEAGKVNLQKEINLTNSIYEEEFILSHLPKGNYFVKITHEESISTQKIILQ